ncbi:MAG: hypothetical protein KJZ90_00145 [Rhodocyclaceae bacterium]|nr:hypothetical protein [Rhodocyclaceae bacterium]
MKKTFLIVGLLVAFGIVGRMDYEDQKTDEASAGEHVAWVKDCQVRGLPLKKCPVSGPVVAQR